MDCRRSIVVALGLAWGSCGCVNTDKRPTPPPTPENLSDHTAKREPAGAKRTPRPESLLEAANGYAQDAARPDQTPTMQLQLREQASKAYLQALQINPNYLPALTGLGRLYTQCGDFDRAQELYRKALDKYSREPSLWVDLGMCMMQKKDFESALRYLQKATELDPENRRVLPALGFCLAVTGRSEESVACLTRVYGPAKAHVQVARVMLRTKRDEQARQHLHFALHTNPNLAEARTLLARLDGAAAPAMGPESGDEFQPVAE